MSHLIKIYAVYKFSLSRNVSEQNPTTMNVYFDPQGCQTLLLKESELLLSLGSWTIKVKKTSAACLK